MSDLVVATVVATWTQWVDLKVAARSRSGSFTGWSDLGVGCSNGGQIGVGVGCSWRSNWLRGGLFTESVTMRNGSAEWDGSAEYPLLAWLERWVFFLWV